MEVNDRKKQDIWDDKITFYCVKRVAYIYGVYCPIVSSVYDNDYIALHFMIG